MSLWKREKNARKISKSRFFKENKIMLSLHTYLIPMLKVTTFPGYKVTFTVTDRMEFMSISEFPQKLRPAIHLWLSRHMKFCVQITKLSQTRL